MPSQNNLSLTPQNIKTAKCPADKAKLILRDSHCTGLMLEVRSSGGKTYYLCYTDLHGKSRQIKLANEQDVSLTEARLLAQRARNKLAMGIDPLESKAALKQVPTVSAFIHERYLPFVRTYKRSWKCDRGLLQNHVESVWGNRHMDQITKQDIVALITKHRQTHAAGSCNRVLILVRYLFNLAIKWDIPGVTKNPTEGYPLLPENNKRELYLKAGEAEVLYRHLLNSDNPMLKFIIPMLLYTGARKREVLDARWENFDIAGKLWCIPMSKSGQRRHVPLSDGAVALLQTVRASRYANDEWVFANPDTAKPYVSMYYSWDTARKAANMPTLRIHDLRHTFASFLVNGGRSLYEVKQILGHTQIKTTQRYAHLSQESLISAANEAVKCLPSLQIGGQAHVALSPSA